MEQYFSNLSKKKYEKIKNRYWVLTKPNEKADPYSWVFSITKPEDIVDSDRKWRNPKYDEAVNRQIAYDCDPENFMKLCNSKIKIIK